MTMRPFEADPNLASPLAPESPAGSGGAPLHAEGVVPPSERGQDVGREVFVESLTSGAADVPAEGDMVDPAPRVYAPASERVPKEPAPGDDQIVEHPDLQTPERLHASSAGTRVATPPHAPAPNASAGPTRPRPNGWLMAGAGMLLVAGVSTLAAWLYDRRRREQNKPINRVRRQARMALEQVQEHVPEAVRETPYAAPASAVALTLLLSAFGAVRALGAREQSHAVPVEQVSGKAKRVARGSRQVADRARDRGRETLDSMEDRWHVTRFPRPGGNGKTHLGS